MMFDWLMQHGPIVLEAVGLVLMAASLIAGLTPTPKDDMVIRKIIEFVSFLKPRDAPGTFKRPFKR